MKNPRGRPPKEVTIRDVARKAETSVGSVSRYLHRERVSPEVARRVSSAIEALGYLPQPRKSRTNRWGLVVPSLSIDFFATIADVLQRCADAQGAALLTFSTNDTLEVEEQALRALADVGVEGVVIAPVSDDMSDVSILTRRSPVTVVAIDRRPSMGGVTDVILADNRSGARQATDFLLSRGYEHLGCILSPTTITSARQRREGFVGSLMDHGKGIDNSMIIAAESTTPQGGEQAMNALLDRPVPPDAVFVGNSDLAAGALLAMKERALRLNEDIAMVAYDNPAWTEAVGLTTIQQPVVELAEAAARALIARMAGERIQSFVPLHPQLIRPDCTPHKRALIRAV